MSYTTIDKVTPICELSSYFHKTDQVWIEFHNQNPACISCFSIHATYSADRIQIDLITLMIVYKFDSEILNGRDYLGDIVASGG
jgi:hypothetical protein